MNLDANISTGKYGIEKQLAQDVEGTRTQLEGSVETIRYLTQQGLALWGHDESEESLNRGNFIELLKLLCKCDADLAKVALKRLIKMISIPVHLSRKIYSMRMPNSFANGLTKNKATHVIA